MKLIKLRGFKDSPVYINPSNINAIGVYGDDGSGTWIEMVGCDDDHYFTIEQPIKEVIQLIEGYDALTAEDILR